VRERGGRRTIVERRVEDVPASIQDLNSMIIEAYIKPPDLEFAWQSLMAAPSGFRPISFSSEEDKIEGAVSDAVKFREFIANNRSGFFLIAEQARYNFTSRAKNVFSRLTVDLLTEEATERDAIAILMTLAGNGLVFAFAASLDEYHHRNKYFRTMGINHIEGWVGRDLQKCIPGIYWLTIMSDECFQLLTQSPASISGETKVSSFGKRHWLIRTFENMNDWKVNFREVDTWCSGQPNVFSLERIRPQLDAADNFMKLSALLAQWR
jgi:hypothetical protein